MKLNADLVFGALKERYTVAMTGPKTTELTISRPELYLDNEREFLSDHLYLATVDHLPLHPRLQENVVIIVIGESAKLSYYREKSCLMVIREKADFFGVHKYICQVFDRYYQWERELFDIFLKSADLQEIVNCSVPIFGRPIHVMDASFHYLTQMKGQPQEVRLEPQEISSYLASFDMATDRHGAVLLDIQGGQYLYINLFNEAGGYIGCIYLEGGSRPFNEGEKGLAEFLGGLMEKAIERNPSMITSEQATLKSALINLVNEYPLTANQKWSLSMGKGSQHFVCITQHSANRFSRLPRGYICGALESEFPGSVAFPKENVIVCFLDVSSLTDRQGSYYAGLNRKLKKFLAETSGIAGISNGFTNLSGARIAYIQAEAAIENGRVTNPESSFFYFRSYALVSMIINASGNLPAEAYFSESLQKLIEHDKTGPISYLNTLRVFLCNSMSYSRTAEELYIHRSTVVDRISRIERELEVDLRDPDTRLQLEIILKAMEIEDMVHLSRE